jgi:uncharacterized protein YggE
MRIPLPVAALFLIVAPVVRGQSILMQVDTNRTVIQATGQARQTMAPDRATLMIMIDAQAMSSDEAASRLASTERGVLDTLRRLNLSASAVQSYNGGVAPYRSQNMPPSMSGGPTFAGRSTIRVEVTRLDQLSTVTSAALAKGASYISPPIFAVSASDSVRRVLLPRALEQAQRDAEALARATGGHLGRLIDVTAPQSTNFAEQQSQQMFYSNVYYDSGARVAPNTTISTTVTGRWLLVPNSR